MLFEISPNKTLMTTKEINQREGRPVLHLCLQDQRWVSLTLKDAPCFLYNEPPGSEVFHQASTYDIDLKAWRCAIVLENTALLVKLAPGNTIALDTHH